jgi:hypothetical protein
VGHPPLTFKLIELLLKLRTPMVETIKLGRQ